MSAASLLSAYPKEIAKEFGCCETAIRKAFKRSGITHKKDGTKTISLDDVNGSDLEAFGPP